MASCPRVGCGAASRTECTRAGSLEWGLLLGVVALGGIAWVAGARGRTTLDQAERARRILGEYAERGPSR